MHTFYHIDQVLASLATEGKHAHTSYALPSAVRIASFRPPRAAYPSLIIAVFLCSATADDAARRTPAAHSPRATWALIAHGSLPLLTIEVVVLC